MHWSNITRRWKPKQQIRCVVLIVTMHCLMKKWSAFLIPLKWQAMSQIGVLIQHNYCCKINQNKINHNQPPKALHQTFSAYLEFDAPAFCSHMYAELYKQLADFFWHTEKCCSKWCEERSSVAVDEMFEFWQNQFKIDWFVDLSTRGKIIILCLCKHLPKITDTG